MFQRCGIINVAANASHGSLQSPLFDDATFEILPIPEAGGLEGPTLVTYRQLRGANGGDLSPFVPERLLDRPAHLDPEFRTMTYGDNTNRGRGGNLKRLGPGDLLFFLGRLVRWHDGEFTKEAGFYLLGFFEIAEILRNVRSPMSPRPIYQWSDNAHVRRARADPRYWDSFWIFQGTRRSRRFRHAVPFTRALAQEVMVTAQGEAWAWKHHRTELQTIGSYTRTCHVMDLPWSAPRVLHLLQHIEAHGEPMEPWSSSKPLIRALAWPTVGSASHAQTV